MNLGNTFATRIKGIWEKQTYPASSHLQMKCMANQMSLLHQINLENIASLFCMAENFPCWVNFIRYFSLKGEKQYKIEIINIVINVTWISVLCLRLFHNLFALLQIKRKLNIKLSNFVYILFN